MFAFFASLLFVFRSACWERFLLTWCYSATNRAHLASTVNAVGSSVFTLHLLLYANPVQSGHPVRLHRQILEAALTADHIRCLLSLALTLLPATYRLFPLSL